MTGVEFLEMFGFDCLSSGGPLIIFVEVNIISFLETLISILRMIVLVVCVRALSYVVIYSRDGEEKQIEKGL